MSSVSQQQPAASADGYAVQLAEEDITSILDELGYRSARAPSDSTRNQRALVVGGSSFKAKQTRRRLRTHSGRQQVWMRLRKASQEQHARVANRLPLQNHDGHSMQAVSTESSLRSSRFVALREGTARIRTSRQPLHDRGMSQTFSTFFHDKTAKAKAKVSNTQGSGWTTNSPKLRSTSATDIDLLDVRHLLEVIGERGIQAHLQNCQTRHHRIDYIHTPVLKSCSDVLSPLIAHLANLSFFARGGFLTGSR